MVADLPHRCDANVSGTSDISCPFAENTFYEYFKATHGNLTDATVQVWSPTTKRYYTEDCSAAESIECVHGNGSEVRLSRSAIAAYTQAEASAYAATADLGANG